jgi:hypothetical protein
MYIWSHVEGSHSEKLSLKHLWLDLKSWDFFGWQTRCLAWALHPPPPPHCSGKLGGSSSPAIGPDDGIHLTDSGRYHLFTNLATLIKKKFKFSLNIKKFRVEKLQSHIWGRLPNTVYEGMCKYFPIYEEAVSHIWLCNCSTLNFLIYEENIIFFFISVGLCRLRMTIYWTLPSASTK